MTSEEIRKRVDSRPWFHRIEVAPGIVTPGAEDTPRKAALIEFPADFTGKSVLDVGAWDGYFSFEAERRGAARVLAYDQYSPDKCGFNTAKEILRSKVEHRRGSVYDLSPETVGTFDVVLFLGVIYHLRNPLLALEKLHAVCEGVMFLESQVMAGGLVGDGDSTHADLDERLRRLPVAEFLPGAELRNDATNWWAPTTRCLEQWIQSHGFAPTLLAEWPSVPGARAAFRCVKSQAELPWFVTTT